MSAPGSTPRATRAGNRVVIAATAVDSVAMGTILPALPFIVLSIGVGSAGLGTLVAAASVAGMIGAPLWGALADRYGTRRLLLIAPLIAATGHVIFAFSDSYAQLLAARIIAGFGSAVVLLAQTHASLTVTDENRTEVLGRVTAAQGVGNIVGPAIGGLLVSYGMLAVGLTAAAGPLAAWLLTLLLLPDARQDTAKPRSGRNRFAAAGDALRSPRLRWLSLAILIGWLCFSGYATVLAIELSHRLDVTATFYGVMVAISGVVAIVVRGLLLGPLVRRLGEIRLMVLGASMIGTSMLLAPLIPTLWLAPVLPLTWALGASLLFPSTVGEISKLAPKGAVGLAMGAAAMLANIGIVFGPIAAGLVQEYLWQQGPFYFGAALFAVVAVLVTIRPGPAVPNEPAEVAAPEELSDRGDLTAAAVAEPATVAEAAGNPAGAVVEGTEPTRTRPER